ncbi:MAG TPA: hypothetical protein PLP50_08455 [Thermoanaerobaculia bacterium]|nr:hypothetical protein [Thermoanaerobaculia bacterium]HQN09587.1 hypothetical protein [Thermoanaerobaculia bacterium]HQP87207.1 hypothetical protein [Thermoanaerobaculia bacterium]
MTPSPTAAFGDAPGSDLRRTPWYLREVPSPVAAVVVSPLVLVAHVAGLVLGAVFLAALAVLLVAPGLGFVYLLIPDAAFGPRPGHLALAAVLGAALWSLVFITMTRVVRWSTLACSAKRLRS